jgi:hypothetical protein
LGLKGEAKAIIFWDGFDHMSKDTITRKCVVCGKNFEITLLENSKYEGGHYFGKIEIPIGEGEHKVIGQSDILGKDKKVDVVEWTGESKEIEYWECDDCYYE